MIKHICKGSIIPNGVVLEAHESATIVYFTELGYDIELIPRSNMQGIHKPDIIMHGVEWEMKSPKGSGKWLMKNTLQKAKEQSENVIVDLRRVKLKQEKCVADLKREFDHSKRIKRIKVILKNGQLLEFNK